MYSMENYDEMDTDTESDHLEEDGKPQPMAGFRTGFVSPGKKDRAGFLEEDVPVGLRKSVSAPPILAPMSMCYGAGASGSYNTFPEKTNCVYFQAEIDIESLVDWQQVNESGMWEQNNNYGDMDQAALVNVNNKEVAVFKYGENVIGECLFEAYAFYIRSENLTSLLTLKGLSCAPLCEILDT